MPRERQPFHRELGQLTGRLRAVSLRAHVDVLTELSQLAQTAEYRGIRPYGLVQPHFSYLGPVIVSSRATLRGSLDSFHQSRESLLRLTQQYTVPEIILSPDKYYRQSLLEDVAKASNWNVPAMFISEDFVLANTVARLYMEEDSVRDRGIKHLEEASASPIRDLLAAERIPTVFAIAIEFGNEDEEVRNKVSAFVCQAHAKRCD